MKNKLFTKKTFRGLNGLFEDLPYSRAEEVKEYFSLSDEKLAEVLGVKKEALEEMKKINHLDAKTAAMVLKITLVLSIAFDFFEKEESVKIWLTLPAWGLGNKIPLYVLKNDKWLDEIVNLLGRLKYGICA